MSAEVLWEIDWPTVFAAQGTIDLSAPGATITVDGVTMRNRSLAAGDPNDPIVPVQYELTANGLEVEFSGAGNNCDSDALSPVAPALLVTLDDIATALNFDPDPTRRYILQTYVPAFTTDSTVNISGSGCGLWRRPGDPVAGGATAQVWFGTSSGASDVPVYLWTDDGGMTVDTVSRTGAPLTRILTLTTGPAAPNMQGWAAIAPGPFVWPTFANHVKVGDGQGPVTVTLASFAQLPYDAFSTFVCVALFQQQHNGTTNVTNERFRLLRI